MRLPDVLAQCHHQHAIRAHPDRGRERRVEAKSAVGVVGAADAHRGEEQGDGGGSQSVRGQDSRGARDDHRIPGPVRQRAVAVLDEDRYSATRDLGGGDTDRLDESAADVVADAAPRDRANHQLLEGLGVEQSVEPLWRLPLAKRLGGSSEAEQFSRQAQHVARRERKDLLDPHSLPEFDESVAAIPVEFGGGREEASVNRTNRGSAEDVERDRMSEPLRKFVQQVVDHSRLIGAPRASTGEDQRALRARTTVEPGRGPRFSQLARRILRSGYRSGCARPP